jgi:excinuclease UvrABC ATPase subunit
VLIVEHNMDVIKTADWVIDLGPDVETEGAALYVPERRRPLPTARRVSQVNI